MEERTLELTKEQAIAEHRKMWNWIAEEILKRKDIVTKEDYFREHNITRKPRLLCYACDYADYALEMRCYSTPIRCTSCPIDWNGKISCTTDGSPYDCWTDCVMDYDYLKAANYAKQIAELPERRDV